VLSKIKNQPLDEIIITIPAKFSSKMRHNTLLSAKIAGLPVSKIKLLDEPIAALFSDWDLDSNFFSSVDEKNETVLVYDLGGGTIDVSILKIDKHLNTVEIISSSRYNNTGGIDWDLEIAGFLLSEIQNHPDYNGYFEIDDRILKRSRMLRLMIQSKKLKEKIDDILFENGHIEDDKTPLRTDFIEFVNSEEAKFSYTISLDYFVSLGLKEITVNFNDILKSFAHLFDLSETDSENFFKPIDQAISKKGVNLDFKRIDKLFLTGGGSNSKLICNQLSIKTYARFIKLDSKYAISKGAVNFSLAFNKDNISSWKLVEKTTEKIFLGISGRSFIEIFDLGLKIPSEGESVDLEKEKIALRQIAIFDDYSNCYRLSLYQGISSNDPMLRPFIQVELKHFNTLDTYNDIYIKSIKGEIDENSIYKFAFLFEDSSIPKRQEVRKIEFDIDKSLQFKKFKKVSKLRINNVERLNKILTI